MRAFSERTETKKTRRMPNSTKTCGLNNVRIHVVVFWGGVHCRLLILHQHFGEKYFFTFSNLKTEAEISSETLVYGATTQKTCHL
jgi:rRNA maturation protein Rpf1